MFTNARLSNLEVCVRCVSAANWSANAGSERKCGQVCGGAAASSCRPFERFICA
jgi:ribosomal protein L40E